MVDESCSSSSLSSSSSVSSSSDSEKESDESLDSSNSSSHKELEQHQEEVKGQSRMDKGIKCDDKECITFDDKIDQSNFESVSKGGRQHAGDGLYECHEYAIVMNCHDKLYNKIPDMNFAFGKCHMSPNGLFWCYNAITQLLWLDEVKGTAISSSWLWIIEEKAWKVIRLGEGEIVEKDGIIFNE